MLPYLIIYRNICGLNYKNKIHSMEKKINKIITVFVVEFIQNNKSTSKYRYHSNACCAVCTWIIESIHSWNEWQFSNVEHNKLPLNIPTIKSIQSESNECWRWKVSEAKEMLFSTWKINKVMKWFEKRK